MLATVVNFSGGVAATRGLQTEAPVVRVACANNDVSAGGLVVRRDRFCRRYFGDRALSSEMSMLQDNSSMYVPFYGICTENTHRNNYSVSAVREKIKINKETCLLRFNFFLFITTYA